MLVRHSVPRKMILYFALPIFFAGITFAAVPSYIQVCGRKNHQLDDCVLRSINDLRDKLRQGIPELNVSSIEPITLDKIQLSNEPSFKAVAHNVHLFGFTDFELTSVRVDLSKKRIDLDMAFKKIRLAAEGDMKAKVLVPIIGRGPVHLIAEDVKAQLILMFDVVDEACAKRLNFTSMTTKLHIRTYTSLFQSWEGSDAVLAAGINTVLCEHQQEVIETITPNLESDVSKLLLKLANKICKNYTYDELLPDRE